MTVPSGIAGVFDRAAATYDNVGVPWFQPIARGLVDELAVRAGERILDIGCGRGAALIPLAEATGPTGSVLGIDLAPAMVALTAADVADLPQAQVRVGDASALGLAPDSYDVIASSLVLFFLPDPQASLTSWAELLVIGGRLGISTFGPQDERWQDVDSVFRAYLPQAMLDARTSGQRGPFASDEGVAQLFDGAGLVEVATAHRTIEAHFRDAEQWLAFSWSHGQRMMWEMVPDGERAAVRERLLEKLAGHADADGQLTFSQSCRYTLGQRP